MTVVIVRYFGKLRELIGAKTEEYALNEGATVTDLLVRHIPERHLEISRVWVETLFRTIKNEVIQNKNGTPVLKNYMIVVNGKTAKLEDSLKEGDEVTIMPPFGGG